MKKVLVTYASKCGSTAEVAQVIAERLAQQGDGVDVKPVEEVHDLAGYDAVVVGSVIVQQFHEAGNSPAGRKSAAAWVGKMVKAVKEV